MSLESSHELYFEYRELWYGLQNAKNTLPEIDVDNDAIMHLEDLVDVYPVADRLLAAKQAKMEARLERQRLNSVVAGNELAMHLIVAKQVYIDQKDIWHAEALQEDEQRTTRKLL